MPGNRSIWKVNTREFSWKNIDVDEDCSGYVTENAVFEVKMKNRYFELLETEKLPRVSVCLKILLILLSRLRYTDASKYIKASSA